MTVDKDLAKVILALFEHNFEFPVILVMIGVNGAYLAAKFELSSVGGKLTTTTEFKQTVLTGEAKNLRFPINTMFVDAKGMAAHVCAKTPDKWGELTFFPGESDVPPATWEKSLPNA